MVNFEPVIDWLAEPVNQWITKQVASSFFSPPAMRWRRRSWRSSWTSQRKAERSTVLSSSMIKQVRRKERWRYFVHYLGHVMEEVIPNEELQVQYIPRNPVSRWSLPLLCSLPYFYSGLFSFYHTLVSRVIQCAAVASENEVSFTK